MVDKLIRGRIIEILMIIFLVILSIPVWQGFGKRISMAEVTTLDDYKIDFNIYSTQKSDRIVIKNEYYINKNYKILLVVNQNFNENNSSITINDIEYSIDNFYKEKNKNNYVYTLVDNYISGNIDYYEIKPKINGEINDYSYVFEEKTIF